MSKFKRLAALILAAAMLTSCSNAENERPELLEPVNAKLESTIVERRDLSNIKLYDAEVLPHAEEIGFEVDGYLYGLYVSAGDRVGEGEVLASLTGPNFRKISDLEDEIAELKESNETDFTYLEAELELARLAGDDTAELELEMKHEKEMAELRLKEKEDRLEALKEDDFGYIFITAPADCTVMAVTSTREGGYIAAGTPVVALDNGGELMITCNFISENMMNNADDCYALIGGSRYDVAYRAYTKDELRILSANSITPVSQFTFADGAPDVEAGDYAVIVMVNSTRENVLVVPAGSVYSDANGKFVYEVVDGTRIRREVVTGITDSVYVEIVEGIGEGASVYVKN